MFSGLDRGARPTDSTAGPGLESRLYTDLARVGFPRDSIDHLEVGRVCRKQVHAFRAKHCALVRDTHGAMVRDTHGAMACSVDRSYWTAPDTLHAHAWRVAARCS